MTAYVDGLLLVLVFYDVLPAPQPIGKVKMKITTKVHLYSSAGTAADSGLQLIVIPSASL